MNIKALNIRTTGIVTFAAVLVVACGGGGGGGFSGGGPETATAIITEDNAEDIIRAIASSSEFAQGLLLGLVLGVDSLSASSAKTAADNGKLMLNALVLSAVSDNITTEADLQFGVQPAVYVVCSGGGSANVVEGDTTITYTFNDCIDFSYDGVSFPGTTDGAFVLDVLSAQSLQDFVVELTWIEFSSEDDGDMFMADGDMILDYYQTSSVIRFYFKTDRFDYTENEQSGSLTNYNYNIDFTLARFMEDGSGGVESSEFTGLAFFNINPNFITLDDDDHSSSGQMIIYGINNTKIRLTALDALTAQIELDLTGGDPDGGDDIYEIDYTIAWDELMQVLLP